MKTPTPCEHVEEQLTAWLLGDLPAETAAAVKAHVDGCESCRKLATDLEATVGLLKTALAAPADGKPKALSPERLAAVRQTASTAAAAGTPADPEAAPNRASVTASAPHRPPKTGWSLWWPRLMKAAAVVVVLMTIHTIVTIRLARQLSDFGAKFNPVFPYLACFKMNEIVAGDGSSVVAECKQAVALPASDAAALGDKNAYGVNAGMGVASAEPRAMPASRPMGAVHEFFAGTAGKHKESANLGLDTKKAVAKADTRPLAGLAEPEAELAKAESLSGAVVRNGLADARTEVALREKALGGSGAVSAGETVAVITDEGRVAYGRAYGGAVAPRAPVAPAKPMREVAPVAVAAMPPPAPMVVTAPATTRPVVAGDKLDGVNTYSGAVTVTGGGLMKAGAAVASVEGNEIAAAPAAEAADALVQAAERVPESRPAAARPMRGIGGGGDGVYAARIGGKSRVLADARQRLDKSGADATAPGLELADRAMKEEVAAKDLESNAKAQARLERQRRWDEESAKIPDVSKLSEVRGKWNEVDAGQKLAQAKGTAVRGGEQRYAMELDQRVDEAVSAPRELAQAVVMDELKAADAPASSKRDREEKLRETDADAPSLAPLKKELAAEALVQNQEPVPAVKSELEAAPQELASASAPVRQVQEQLKAVADDVAPATPVVNDISTINPFVMTAANAFSTFSIDVDTASYGMARRALLEGRRPAPGSIRVEEFVNAFDYDYPPPPSGRAFAIYADEAPSPFRVEPGLDLLKIGIKGYQLGRDQKHRAVLTFVVDTSGSMNTPERLGLVKKSLALLVGQLQVDDRVAVVQFSNQPRLVLPPTPVSEKAAILAAVNGLQAGGSTHLENGLRLGYSVAAGAFTPKAANRVLLLSDGVANLGAADAASILQDVEKYRKLGIYLSVFGIGSGAYNDKMLEDLADKGDGSYLFLDSEAAAKQALVDQLAANLFVIAKDVKIQVEFNPARVKRFRQIGYENRQLTKEQFRDDTVDAGEVGAGQSVTALYEIELQGNAREPVGTVRVRYRNVETGAVEEIQRPVTVRDRTADFAKAPVRFRLAAGVAAFAEQLRGSPYADADAGRLASVLNPVALELPLDGSIRELCRLVQAARE